MVHVLPLTARNDAALRSAAAGLREVLETSALAEVERRLCTEPTASGRRAVVIASNSEDAREGLRNLVAGEPSGHVVVGPDESVRHNGERTTAFLFPGQGSYWEGMAIDLLEQSTVFAERFGQCDDAVRELGAGAGLLGGADAEPGELGRTPAATQQPVLLAVMLGLAEMWQHLGVQPNVCVGHSQGDIAAAVVAGALTTRHAMCIVTARSSLYDTLAGSGTMAVVGMDAASLAKILPSRVNIAAENAPAETVVSGDGDAVEKLLQELKAAGYVGKVIRDNDIAGHSPRVEALQARLFALLADVELRPTGRPFVSSVKGGVLEHSYVGAEYWYDNMRHTVRFREATETVIRLGAHEFIEVSPHPLLGPAVLSTGRAMGVEVAHHGTLSRRRGGVRQLLKSVAGYFTAGGQVDWSRVHSL